jgi:hypothetical protein
LYGVCWVIKTLLERKNEEIYQDRVSFDKSEVVSREVEGRAQEMLA